MRQTQWSSRNTEELLYQGLLTNNEPPSHFASVADSNTSHVALSAVKRISVFVSGQDFEWGKSVCIISPKAVKLREYQSPISMEYK